MSAMFRIVEDENGPPVPESSSIELRAFLAKCFKKDPRERPTAQELAEDPWLLQHFVPHQVSQSFILLSSRVGLTIPIHRTCDLKTLSLSFDESREIINELVLLSTCLVQSLPSRLSFTTLLSASSPSFRSKPLHHLSPKLLGSSEIL